MLAVELRFRRVNGENLRTERPVPGVCPSLPGYGFSDKPAAPGWGIERMSDAWCELMARLGYRRFGAQGSDWGASIATSIGQRQPDRVAGSHLMPPLAPPDPATSDDLTGAERAALATLREADEWGWRILGAAVDPAADGRLRAGRLAGRPLRLDRREVLVVDRLRWRPASGYYPG
ncbi:alpha/beta fold hydrolase [Amycolatopsis sp. cg9]|uniref:alpha/beta fold hydrolase n=1 Tax=Amycolatopsis sp. cg9 TaxID=3238801 RepID=UPI00352490FF